MIRERPAGSGLIGTSFEAVAVENGARDLLTGHPVGEPHLHLPPDRLLQPALDGKAENQRRDQECEIVAQISHVPPKVTNDHSGHRPDSTPPDEVSRRPRDRCSRASCRATATGACESEVSLLYIQKVSHDERSRDLALRRRRNREQCRTRVVLRQVRTPAATPPNPGRRAGRWRSADAAGIAQGSGYGALVVSGDEEAADGRDEHPDSQGGADARARAQAQPEERLKREKSPLVMLDELPALIATGYADIPEEDIVRLKWWGLYHDKPKIGTFMLRIKLPPGASRRSSCARRRAVERARPRRGRADDAPDDPAPLPRPPVAARTCSPASAQSG